MNDPRDRGFNYASGWGSAPKPPVYLAAMAFTRALSQELSKRSAQLWSLEMALWRVRIATTGAEKAAAVCDLEREWALARERRADA